MFRTHREEQVWTSEEENIMTYLFHCCVFRKMALIFLRMALSSHSLTTSYLMSNVHLNIPNRQHLSVILSPPLYLRSHLGLFSTTHSKIAEIRLNCLKFAGGQAFN